MTRTIHRIIDGAIGIVPQRAWWFFAAVCAAIILYVGSRPGSDIPDLNIFHGLDKVLHGSAYSGLAVCIFRAMYPLKASDLPRVVLPWLPVILGPFLIGAIDEWHQGYVPGRSQDMFDLMADTIGGVWVCVVGVSWRNMVRRDSLEKKRP